MLAVNPWIVPPGRVPFVTVSAIDEGSVKVNFRYVVVDAGTEPVNIVSSAPPPVVVFMDETVVLRAVVAVVVPEHVPAGIAQATEH